MAFTYVDTLAADRDKVRFHLQDTVEDSGPKPGGGNFSNDELDGLLTVENSWQEAVAAGLETLAAAWASSPSFEADGLSISRSDVAKSYKSLAEKWRNEYGSTGKTSGSRTVTRADGYSDSYTNIET